MPLLDVGKSEGDEAYLFSRIVQASTLPRGELVVADRDTRDLRIFDSTGKVVGRVGRKGSGPGEFQALAWVGVDQSGGMAAYDFSLRRLSRFSANGTLDQVVSLESVPVGSVLGQFEDGSLLFSRRIGLPAENDLEKLSTGLVRDSIGLLLIWPDGSSSPGVGEFPGTQSIRAVGKGRIAMSPAPFGLRTMIAVADSVFYVSTQESWEIHAYHKDGRLRSVFRRRVTPEAVTAAANAEWKRQRDERLERQRASGRSLPPEVQGLDAYEALPDFFPAHGDLRVDRSGNLWVQRYSPFPKEDSVTTWLVLDPDGMILATAELPRLEITEIGTDRVVGVWRDEDGVPHVRAFRMVKNRP